MKWLNDNWFKIFVIVLGICALGLWYMQIQQIQIRNYWECQKGDDLSEYSLCASFYPHEAGIK